MDGKPDADIICASAGAKILVQDAKLSSRNTRLCRHTASQSVLYPHNVICFANLHGVPNLQARNQVRLASNARGVVPPRRGRGGSFIVIAAAARDTRTWSGSPQSPSHAKRVMAILRLRALTCFPPPGLQAHTSVACNDNAEGSPPERQPASRAAAGAASGSGQSGGGGLAWGGRCREPAGPLGHAAASAAAQTTGGAGQRCRCARVLHAGGEGRQGLSVSVK